MSGASKGTAVVTGASSGIGAIYADRLTAREMSFGLTVGSRSMASSILFWSSSRA
jgi:short-subunit dehydrogenase